MYTMLLNQMGTSHHEYSKTFHTNSNCDMKLLLNYTPVPPASVCLILLHNVVLSVILLTIRLLILVSKIFFNKMVIVTILSYLLEQWTCGRHFGEQSGIVFAARV